MRDFWKVSLCFFAVTLFSLTLSLLVYFRCSQVRRNFKNSFFGDTVSFDLTTEGEYFTNADKRVYIDLRDSRAYTGEMEILRRNNSEIVLKVHLKEIFTKKMKLRVWGYLSVFGNRTRTNNEV